LLARELARFDPYSSAEKRLEQPTPFRISNLTELCVTNRNEMDQPRDVVFLVVCALLAVATVCATVLCAAPRPAPLELPVLVLDEQKARDQIADDDRLAAQQQSNLSRELYQALRDVGRNELDRNQQRAYALEQRLHGLNRRLTSELDEKGVATVRAYATHRSMRALMARLDDENEERELIGAQRSMFATYGYISPEGSLLAPELTVRAMFKVRWNMIFLRKQPTHGLSPIELYAYEGFRALEAEQLPPHVRMTALYELIRAGGGLRAERALAIFQAANGKGGPLIARVQNSEQESGQLRLRNMALSLTARR
jgi:hypothetical protein